MLYFPVIATKNDVTFIYVFKIQLLLCEYRQVNQKEKNGL